MTAHDSLMIGLTGPLPPPSGGMANQTRQLARLLTETGCAVELVQVNPPYRPAWIRHIRGVRALFRLVPYLIRLWTAAGRVDVIHVMANSGWAWHLFAAPAIWIAALRGTPVVVNYRGGEAPTFLARQARFVLPTLAKAAALIVPSGFLAGVFREYGVHAEIVQNIVDLSRFRRGDPATDRVHVIVTRNLETIYDIGTAIRAFAIVRERVPSAKMTIAGSGPCREELVRLCDELGAADSIRFAGRMDNERIAELYRSATLLLNPSRVDNMPISLLEAMASAVPIVTTNVGGIPHLVTHERTALLVEPGDVEGMARAALRLIEDRDTATRLCDAGLEAVQAYTWERVKPLLLDCYRKARARRRTGPRADKVGT